ncbi:hypothetical protein F183_A31250 [Bryobacterales bacterium F-183]|nr:hypothetical protein F183_A31250 [Bryobacterales bacterium F-183]
MDELKKRQDGVDAQLDREFARRVDGVAANPAVVASVQAKLKTSLQPVTPQASPNVLAMQYLLAFAVFSAPFSGLAGTAGVRQMTALQIAAMVAILVGGAALVSFSIAWQMSPGSLHQISPLLALVILVAGFLAIAAVCFPWGRRPDFVDHGWPCLTAGLIMASVSSVLFWGMVRRGRSLATATFGGSLGAMAGLVGAAALQIACNELQATHLLVWHGGVVVIPLVLGSALLWWRNERVQVGL